MALLPTRREDYTTTDYFMTEVAEAGAVVCFGATSGVGSSLDDVNAVVRLPNNANGSGESPVGVLLGDVVNKDLTQTHLNQYKREIQVGGKVGLMRRGEVVTNMIHTGTTPVVGAAVYFTTDGLLASTSTNSTRIGTWLSAKDPNGYAKISVNIA